MIHKTTLQSIISKYYLNGENNQVKWRIKDKQLVIYTGKKGQTSKVVVKNFDFEDAELGIFDTHKLSKLIAITSGDLILKTEKIKVVHSKLYIADANFDLTYSLADTLIFGKSPQYNDPEEYEVILDLSSEDVSNLIKAKTALLDVDNMLITTTTNADGIPLCDFIFGDNTGFSNKITYGVQGNIKENGIELPFNSNIFKDILNSNKDMDKTTLKISTLGAIKFEFSSDEIESEYFLLRNE